LSQKNKPKILAKNFVSRQSNTNEEIAEIFLQIHLTKKDKQGGIYVEKRKEIWEQGHRCRLH